MTEAPLAELAEDLAQDRALVAQAEAIIRQGSKSFAAAARLFDPTTRARAYFLYAWCRHCDDVIDGQALGHDAAEPSPEDKRARLAELQRATRAALAGAPTSDPVFRAFQQVARAVDLPQAYPLEHLAGFAMDVEGTAYGALQDLLVYCWRVAGVVGVMMAHVMGAREAEVLRRAADLGLAFQLTNIARDVVADARVGRLYLPADWLAEAGVPATPEAVADPAHRRAVFGVTQRLIAAAEPYYDSAREGLPALPFRSAWAVAAARGVYREIGRSVARAGPAAFDGRTTVSGAAKTLRLLEGGLLAARAASLGRAFPPKPRPVTLWSPL